MSFFCPTTSHGRIFNNSEFKKIINAKFCLNNIKIKFRSKINMLIFVTNLFI